MFFLIAVPHPLAEMLGSFSFYSSRMYPMSLATQGDPNAGMSGTSENMVYLTTTKWSTLAANMATGNAMAVVTPVDLPGTPLPLRLSLVYNHSNADLDIGLGKGWMMNIHTSATVDPLSMDILYVTATGHHLSFPWDAQTSSHQNPYGFAGKAEILGGGKVSITPLQGNTLIFGQDGKLEKMEDSCTEGYQEITYDQGRPTEITDGLSGRSIELVWSQQSKLLEIEDPAGRSWELEYDGSGDYLVSITPPSLELDPSALSFGYDTLDTGFMNEHTDRMGYTYSLLYYDTGSFDEWFEGWTDPSTASIGLEYDDQVQGMELVTTFVDGEAREIHYSFNNEGFLVQMEQREGQNTSTWNITYTPQGWRSSVTNPMGHTSMMGYDLVGHPINRQGPPPAQGITPYREEWSYMPANNVDGLLTEHKERVTSSVWNSTILQYQDQNNPYQPSLITNSLMETIQISYNTDGFPETVVVPTVGGTKSMSLSYSPYTGALLSTTNFGGNVTQYGYNALGLPDTITAFEGTVMGGRRVSDLEIFYDFLGQALGTSDSVKFTTTTMNYSYNGAMVDNQNESGCSSKTEYAILDIPNVAYITMVPPWVRGLIDNSQPASLPYNPLPATFTNSMNRTTEFAYDASGKRIGMTEHLGRETTYAYDTIGRLEEIVDPFGRSTTCFYNQGHQVTALEIDGLGTATYDYDNAGRLKEMDHPVKGLIEYTYNVRGNKLSDDKGSFTYDILGRMTLHPTEGSFTYTPEGQVASKNGKTFAYDEVGNLTSWDGESETFSFDYASPGFARLGLPSSMSSALSSYDYQYHSERFWLIQVEDTSKGTGLTFDYLWSSAGELEGIEYANDTELNQTWVSKQLTELTVKHGQNTWLNSKQSYSNVQLIDELDFFVFAGSGNPPLAESYEMDYDGSSHLSSLSRNSDNREITYGYDQALGRLNSLAFSDLGAYTLDYSSEGLLDTVTYPEQQGQESYTYGNEGQLQSILYPDNTTLSLNWNDRDKVSNLIYVDDQQETHQYALTYDNRGNLKSASYASGGLQIHTWEFQWGPQGLELGTKHIGMNPVVTQNFSTDPFGRILSLTYQSPTYNGELYFHYDVQGNTSLLTDSNGQPVASFRYDVHSGQIAEYWNPSNLEIVNMKGGIRGSIRITTAVTGFNRDLYIQPWPPIEISPPAANGNGNGNDWGSVVASPGFTGVSFAGFQTENDCMSDADRFRLCMARCFTFGEDNIGCLNTPRSTDSFAFNNISNFEQALFDFYDFVSEFASEGFNWLLILIAVIVGVVIAIYGGKIALATKELLAAAAAVLAGVGVLGQIIDWIKNTLHISESAEALYAKFRSSLSNVRMIGGAWYSQNIPQTTEGDMQKLLNGINQYNTCVAACMKLVYG
jgi:YD repeat-containing protein